MYRHLMNDWADWIRWSAALFAGVLGMFVTWVWRSTSARIDGLQRNHTDILAVLALKSERLVRAETKIEAIHDAFDRIEKRLERIEYKIDNGHGLHS